ncbi:phage tail assembly protein [Sphingobium yanoikuyae]|uniref:Phage tail protein n=1 Tax=Sphingobium yanoikuyae TaxID=13690 RepID=A0A291N281_SPHYA|nr:phage tail assembly protein [Sphingobium yanoikuyae]ATI81453.1 phage tail protein [Sphingobium yanoikuyae]
MTDATTIDLRTVTLDTPVMRGEQTIASLQVRKPHGGELRGLSLSALLNLEYVALETLLTRVTIPPLIKQEVASLDPSDLIQLGSEIMDFLLPKAAKEALSPNG